MNETAGAKAAAAGSVFGAFRHPAFAVIWTATIVANTGSWMYSAASGWLMTSLDPDPLIVSLVQVAAAAPLFLFALPAGALADIFDKRKFLIVLEVATTLVAAIYALLVSLDLATPENLLVFTFLIGAGGALTYPGWQAVVPQLVPRDNLAAAIAANSVGINISRALGPALGGLAIAEFGIASPFWFNAISNLAVIGGLLWWRSRQSIRSLPSERLSGAIWAGLRYARYNLHLRGTLMRSIGFFLFASAYWALLPLVARSQIAGGPGLYGILLGMIGASAVAGGLALPWLRMKLGADRLMVAGTLGTALALALFGVAREPLLALAASALAGCSWIAAVATLSMSAQVALPDWVRGRGLALFTTVFFGAVTLGSAFWGELGARVGLPAALLIAAAGAVATIPLTWRWRLLTGAGLDFTPSMHWPTPITTGEIEHDRGPVLVTVEYRIRPQDRELFLEAIAKLGNERRRDGAYRWGIFEDAAEEGRILETFLVDSWLEHLRQHERVTNADRLIQEAVGRFQLAGEPKVTHFIAAEP
jgi:MFS family permease